MKKSISSRICSWIFLIIPISIIPISPCFSEPQQGKTGFGAKALVEILSSTNDDSVRIDIKGDGFLLNYSIFQLSDPSRLVLDFPEMMNATGKSDIQIGHRILTSILIAQHPQKARVVFGFPGDKLPTNKIEKRGDTLTIFFYGTKIQEELQQGGEEKGTEEGGRNQVTEPRDQRARYGVGRISLDFNEADIRLVIQKIAEEAHQNLVVSDAVQGKISLRLIDVPWEEVLEIILRSRNLAITREGDVIQIITQEEYNRKIGGID